MRPAGCRHRIQAETENRSHLHDDQPAPFLSQLNQRLIESTSKRHLARCQEYARPFLTKQTTLRTPSACKEAFIGTNPVGRSTSVNPTPSLQSKPATSWLTVAKKLSFARKTGVISSPEVKGVSGQPEHPVIELHGSSRLERKQILANIVQALLITGYVAHQSRQAVSHLPTSRSSSCNGQG
jgi:hypothetical protein